MDRKSGEEERLKLLFIQMLNRDARFYETVILVMAVFTLFLGFHLDWPRSGAAALAGFSIALIAGFRAYQLRRRVEELWAEILEGGAGPSLAWELLLFVAFAAASALLVVLAGLLGW